MQPRVLTVNVIPLVVALFASAALAADPSSTAKPPKADAAGKAARSAKTSANASGSAKTGSGKTAAAGKSNDVAKSEADSASDEKPKSSGKLEEATFGSGCFWCSEAVFQRIKGVESVVPGYSGGHVKNPTYEQVCTKTTGHAEVVQITFDPGVISYKELLEVFWKSHDPTKLNKQGIDKGPQYRSVIFYHSDEQKELAEHYKKELDKAHIFSHKIVTEIAPFKEFYAAEDYHQNFYNNNPQNEYCQSIIGPKVNKIKRVFKEKLK
jgi:peptide-methionine (S)-S-oxide reductase